MPHHGSRACRARPGNRREAPAHIGKISRPPRPKVKASGGEPTTMSSGVARSTWRGQVSHEASTSRWVCTAALGLPVVPEVKAIMAMSSAAVGQAAKPPSFCAARTASEPGSCPALNATTVASTGRSCRASSSSSSSLASHSATVGCALSMMSPSSRARSSGMVATAISPALTTASQASARPIELPPRSSTRLPGTRPRSSTSTRQMRSTRSRTCGIGQGDRGWTAAAAGRPSPWPAPCPAVPRPGSAEPETAARAGRSAIAATAPGAAAGRGRSGRCWADMSWPPARRAFMPQPRRGRRAWSFTLPSSLCKVATSLSDRPAKASTIQLLVLARHLVEQLAALGR